jgi:hypothetical protein
VANPGDGDEDVNDVKDRNTNNDSTISSKWMIKKSFRGGRPLRCRPLVVLSGLWTAVIPVADPGDDDDEDEDEDDDDDDEDDVKYKTTNNDSIIRNLSTVAGLFDAGLWSSSRGSGQQSFQWRTLVEVLSPLDAAERLSLVTSGEEPTLLLLEVRAYHDDDHDQHHHDDDHDQHHHDDDHDHDHDHDDDNGGGGGGGDDDDKDDDNDDDDDDDARCSVRGWRPRPGWSGGAAPSPASSPAPHPNQNVDDDDDEEEDDDDDDDDDARCSVRGWRPRPGWSGEAAPSPASSPAPPTSHPPKPPSRCCWIIRGQR